MSRTNANSRPSVAACAVRLIVAAASVFLSSAAPATEHEDNVSAPEQYFAKLLGTREGWPDNMTEPEEQIMNEHFRYLKELTQQGKVLMAGPCFDPVFGLVVLQTESREEAEELLKNDPSVKAGLHEYTLSEMRVSLMADNLSVDRYVQEPSDRILHKEVTVTTTIDSAWQAWTTADGVKSFFAPEAQVELRPGGRYEMLFDTGAPYGQQGSEGCRILSFLPNKMLTFEWNAPPSFGELRGQHTRVVLMFSEFEVGKVRLSLSHLGWGRGDKWDELYDYFDRAWGSVLSSFREECEDK